jgi:hypothetical protein
LRVPSPACDLEVGEVRLPELVDGCGLFFELVRSLDHHIGRAGDRQVATLLRFAKSVTNAELSAILVDRASDLKSQLDLVPAVPDGGLSAPDVQIDPGSDLTSQAQRTPSAIEVIVQNYIRLNDRQALTPKFLRLCHHDPFVGDERRIRRMKT